MACVCVGSGKGEKSRRENLYIGISKIGKNLPVDINKNSDINTAELLEADSNVTEDWEDKADTDKSGNHYRTYIRFDDIQIPAGCVVTDAKLALNSKNVYASEKYYYAALVTKDWSVDKITWANQPISASGKILLSDLKLIDYGNGGSDELNITTAVKGWTEGTIPNNGICFIMSNETDAAIGKKKNTTRKEDNVAKLGLSKIEPRKSGRKPFLTVTYKDFTGLESYWSTHDQQAGNAGSGYVSDYIGNLTFVHQDATSAGNRAPISLQHIYNGVFGNRSEDVLWDNGISYEGTHC